MITQPRRPVRLIRLGRAKQLTRGIGGLFLEIAMGRQDEPA